MGKIFKVLLIIPIFIWFIQPGSACGDKIHRLHILSGKSELLKFETEIIRASIADTEVADVVVISPKEILINAKSAGSTSLAVWDKEERTTLYDVNVGIDTTRLEILLKELAPDEEIRVHTKDDTIVLQGRVKKHHTIDQINEVTKDFPKDVVNLIRVDVPEQIMLQVRFAEVQRSAAKDLGIDFFTGAANDFRFGSLPNNLITELCPGGVIEDWSTGAMENVLQIKSGDFFIDLLFDNLEKRGLLRILAEPNLVAVSGEEASFLAGGEIPVPMVTANTVNIEWKEFGIKLNFAPKVTEADTVRLKVKPEVSILDWSNAVKFGGFEIPAFITRRAETVVELKKGESLVIGGLISHTTTEANRKIPGLGDLPVLGSLFKSKSFERNETELLVLVTPRVIQPVRMAGEEEAFSPKELPELFKKGEAPYEDDQADRIKEYFNPTILEDAKTLDDIEEIERQEELERKQAEKAARELERKQAEKESKKNQPETNFTPRTKEDRLENTNRQKALDAAYARLQAEQRMLDSREKEIAEKERDFLSQNQIVRQKEDVIDMIMEINKRLLKERNKRLSER